jgi:hypothetical protein
MPYYALLIITLSICAEISLKTELKDQNHEKNTIWAEADPGEMQLALKLANASSRCEQLATASSLTRNCELGRFDPLSYDVAAYHWSRQATRICECCSSHLRVQAGHGRLSYPIDFVIV